MKTVGLFEAKAHFSAIILEVENGGSVIVTKKRQACGSNRSVRSPGEAA